MLHVKMSQHDQALEDLFRSLRLNLSNTDYSDQLKMAELHRNIGSICF
jgi:hypothetical protein